MSDAMVLLTRIEDIVNIALSKTPATRTARETARDKQPTDCTAVTDNQAPAIKVKGATPNLVSIERDRLDEIRAEVEQLKVILGSS
jgi:hypothetical protein